MLQATCHCGAVSIEVPGQPEFLVDCNCSICRRNGALWAFYPSSSVKLHSHPESTTEYVWGPGAIRTMHCKVCGCTTHWEQRDPNPDQTMGVNARNFEPAVVAGVRVRRFDGAATWEYLD